MTGPVGGGSPPAAASQPGVGSPASRPYATGVSTRRLIAAALVCGLAILVAFTIQITVAAR